MKFMHTSYLLALYSQHRAPHTLSERSDSRMLQRRECCDWWSRAG